MQPADHEPNLNDDDVLSLWVGRVARTHALLEYNVDNVHRFLARQVGHAPGSKSVKGFDQLVSECRKLLQQSDAGREIVTSGDTALLAAREATGLRNRVVHDMWLLDPLREDWEPPRWNTFHRLSDVQQSYNSANSQDLTMVVDTHTLLMRTRMRVSGLFMALHATWPAGRARVEGSPGDETMARYVALMTDRFILHANGDLWGSNHRLTMHDGTDTLDGSPESVDIKAPTLGQPRRNANVKARHQVYTGRQSADAGRRSCRLISWDQVHAGER